jgi:hypothetical protein
MVCRYKIVRIHKLFGTDSQEDVLGPVLGALVRWVEVSKYKVSKHCYISLLPPSPSIPSINSADAERLIMIIINACLRWTTCSWQLRIFIFQVRRTSPLQPILVPPTVFLMLTRVGSWGRR